MARYSNNSGKLEARLVYPRSYKWGPGVPSKAIEFREIPEKKNPFGQFQYFLTNQAGQILSSADGNYYLEPDRP